MPFLKYCVLKSPLTRWMVAWVVFSNGLLLFGGTAPELLMNAVVLANIFASVGSIFGFGPPFIIKLEVVAANTYIAPVGRRYVDRSIIPLLLHRSMLEPIGGYRKKTQSGSTIAAAQGARP